jgi:hypothetical protein
LDTAASNNYGLNKENLCWVFSMSQIERKIEMIKLAHVKEVKRLQSLPQEVVTIVEVIATNLTDILVKVEMLTEGTYSLFRLQRN